VLQVDFCEAPQFTLASFIVMGWELMNIVENPKKDRSYLQVWGRIERVERQAG
jgi:hypothetical protein